MAKISKTFTFEAAHRLMRHNGKCRNLHGHSYIVRVVVEGPIQEDHPLVVGVDQDPISAHNPQAGMVLDFTHLSRWWARLEGSLDHVTILEESDPIAAALTHAGRDGTSMTLLEVAPTAENIALWIRQNLSQYLIDEVGWTDGFVTPKVRVWETAKSWAEA